MEQWQPIKKKPNGNMNAKDVVDFLNSLPKNGDIEVESIGGDFFIRASPDNKFIVHGGCVRIDGETGYGNIGNIESDDSIMLIDPETINFIRYFPGAKK